jgi:hypothetical protein
MGGSIKRSANRVSLQRLYDKQANNKQILTVEDFLKFCTKRNSEVSFIFIEKTDMKCEIA